MPATLSTCSELPEQECDQCGGQGWTGPTCCLPYDKCTVINPYYSQCQPTDFCKTPDFGQCNDTDKGRPSRKDHQCCPPSFECNATDPPYYSQCIPSNVTSNCSQPYGQCGGKGWTGPTCCIPGYVCSKTSDYCAPPPPAQSPRATRPPPTERRVLRRSDSGCDRSRSAPTRGTASAAARTRAASRTRRRAARRASTASRNRSTTRSACRTTRRSSPPEMPIEARSEIACVCCLMLYYSSSLPVGSPIILKNSSASPRSTKPSLSTSSFSKKSNSCSPRAFAAAFCLLHRRRHLGLRQLAVLVLVEVLEHRLCRLRGPARPARRPPRRRRRRRLRRRPGPFS